MSYQNFKGDFPIVEKFFREDTDGGRVQIAVPEHVSITYFTDPQIGIFVAERNGEHCVNCRIVDEPDGTQYLLVGLQLSKCFLGEGELMAVVSEYVNDDLYSGGVRATPIPKRCGIVLYPGASDNSDSVVSSTVLSILGSSVTRLTYASMVSLRDNSRLTSGQFYRITDYITTTTQTDTQSAGHPFDVIVLALNESTLSERAWAIQREGDTYFKNSNLAAWQIWYSLDNDISRFDWADAGNGKGVIYRMIDEWNNDCPYDFKNIQFRIPSLDITDFRYTFGYGTQDATVRYNKVYLNRMAPYVLGAKRMLNANLVLSEAGYIHSNVFGENCYNNVIGKESHSNTFGEGCYNNVTGSYFRANTLGDYCYRNTFGASCQDNTLGNYCYENTFGSQLRGNTFLGFFQNNEIGKTARFNFFGQNIKRNVLGNNFECNHFAGQFLQNVLNVDFCTANTFDEGIGSATITNEDTASANQQIQNYHFMSGLYKTSVVCQRARSYPTTVAVDSEGNVKQFCIADIFDAIEQITIKEE